VELATLGGMAAATATAAVTSGGDGGGGEVPGSNFCICLPSTRGGHLFVTYGEGCLHASRRLCTLLRDASVYVSFMRCASQEKLRFRSTKALPCIFSHTTGYASVCSH